MTEIHSILTPCGKCNRTIGFVPLEIGEFDEFVRKQRRLDPENATWACVTSSSSDIDPSEDSASCKNSSLPTNTAEKASTSFSLLSEISEGSRQLKHQKPSPPSIQQHKLEINGESVGGYDTLHNLPIEEAMKFVKELDNSNIKSGRRLRHGAGYGGEWEPMVEDQGFKVYYYRTHEAGLADQVIHIWSPDPGGKHGSIATNIGKWPKIPCVFQDVGKQVGALYGRSFCEKYFLGQVQLSKMECNDPKELPMSHRTDHNKYSGNKLAAHFDAPREGDVIVSILLAEPTIFRLYNGSKIVLETELSPGSAYCMRCSEEHCFDPERRNVACQLQMCPRHGLKHEIECAHSPSCNAHHAPDSVTRMLPKRHGARFAAVLRYFKR